MNDLIEPEFVTLPKLISLFKNAYIKVEKYSDTGLTVTIDGEEISIQLDTERKLIRLYRLLNTFRKPVLEKHESHLYKKINEFNENLIMNKFYLVLMDDEMYVYGSEYFSRYTCGLNFAQLIDDCNRFSNIFLSSRKQLVDFFKELGYL